MNRRHKKTNVTHSYNNKSGEDSEETAKNKCDDQMVAFLLVHILPAAKLLRTTMSLNICDYPLSFHGLLHLLFRTFHEFDDILLSS